MTLCQNKYKARTDKKKTAIIEAASYLFQEKGFDNTSIKDIAARAQVSQVSIYNYYGSKNALVVEYARSIFKNNFDQAYNLLRSDLPYLEKLEQALSLCTTENIEALNSFLSTPAIKNDKNFMKLLSEGVRQLQKDIYEKYIEEGKKTGYINPTLPTSVILEFIFAVNKIELSEDNYQEELGALQHMILYGVLGEKRQ